MQTRCPQCLAIAPLEADRPIGDAGQATCAACGATFDAYAHLTDVAPAEADAPAPEAAPIDQGELFRRPRTTTVSTAAPRFARERLRAARPPQWRWWLASVALLALLAALYPIADRDRLARDAAWRPTLVSLCATLGCTLPPWSEPTAFATLAREVAPHPSVPGALLITLSFRNGAAFAQAWPMLEVTFSDVNGRQLGLRRFHPQEYLGGAPKEPSIAPGQSVSATLEVVNPGRDAIAYSFDFR